MKITVTRDTLAPALARAAALVPSRITIPIIGCARIETGPGGLSLGTTDCDSWYSETVELEPTEPWSGCVDAARLRGFVHSLPPGSPVELLAPDDRALTIAGTGAKARLAVQRADDFPMFVQPQEGATFDLDAAAFSAALRFVTPSANKDDIRHHLCGAYIDPAGLLVATDGHRMAVHRFAAALPAFDGVILPLPALRLLAAALKGFVDSVSVAVTPRLITFTAGSSSLTSN